MRLHRMSGHSSEARTASLRPRLQPAHRTPPEKAPSAAEVPSKPFEHPPQSAIPSRATNRKRSHDQPKEEKVSSWKRKCHPERSDPGSAVEGSAVQNVSSPNRHNPHKRNNIDLPISFPPPAILEKDREKPGSRSRAKPFRFKILIHNPFLSNILCVHFHSNKTKERTCKTKGEGEGERHFLNRNETLQFGSN